MVTFVRWPALFSATIPAAFAKHSTNGKTFPGPTQDFPDPWLRSVANHENLFELTKTGAFYRRISGVDSSQIWRHELDGVVKVWRDLHTTRAQTSSGRVVDFAPRW
ncbi:secreted protein [Rhodopirellula sallentina SM41]|uniref:Secreted protein n=1 Tax=Rhodopirellula sallentina SM41 TaxID=1263870 RepID=M5U235_9BACT|nr:secreted protein [Rhodopirellula sallentina SM41]